MSEVAKKEDLGTKRLVLGFDGGCLSCSMLAQKIRQRVGDKLEVKNLRDSQVQEWRKQALGEDAPWGPTLFEVDGEEAPRAWTGLRMGVVLTRALGPGGTWRVMQAIGEMRPTKEKLTPFGFSHGQFLTGVGGAALAITLLSGTSKFASPAAAANRNKGREIKGSELIDLTREKALTEDVKNVVGNNWVDRVQNGGCEIAIRTGDNCELVHNHDYWRTEGYCTVPKAMKHKIQGGDNGVLQVAWVVPKEDWVIVYKEYDRPFDPKGKGDLKIETMAKLFKAVKHNADRKDDKLRLVRISINGKERKVGNWT